MEGERKIYYGTNQDEQKNQYEEKNCFSTGYSDELNACIKRLRCD